ncbi:MAG: hypothetical protein ABIJ21_00925 [Nanoarchaeota archaeon]
MVKLIFLGTGGDALVVGKQERASGGIVIQGNSSQMHIDPGPGALVRAREYGVNVRETSAIIVTTPDVIHTNDMGAVVLGMTHGGLDKKGSLLVCDKCAFDAKSHTHALEKIIILTPGHKEYVKDDEILPLATKSLLEGIGIRLAMTPFTISYPGDTDYEEHLAEKYKGTNVLILHCKNHIQATDCERFIQHIQPKLAILTNFGSKMLEANPSNLADQIHKKTRVKTLAATDGMMLDLQELFFTKNQTPLSAFLKSKKQEKTDETPS